MLQSLTGIYDKGKIYFQEPVLHKRSSFFVTFVEDLPAFKLLSSVPQCFKKPVIVQSIEKFSRDQLHER